MFRILLTAFLCLPVLSALPAVAQTADQPTGTITVSDSAQQDAAIATRIRNILQELEGYEDVTVTVSSSVAGARTNSASRISPRSKFTSVRVTV